MTIAMMRKAIVPTSPNRMRPTSTRRTVKATSRKAVFSWFMCRLFPGRGAVNRLPVLPIRLLLQARARGLVGDSELVDCVVVRVGDVGAALLVGVFHDEVEQVAVRAWRQAEDAQVADVADVHRRGRDLGHRPGGRARAQVQV